MSSEETPINNEKQPCPICGEAISIVAGSVDSKCKNCGYKDACCGS